MRYANKSQAFILAGSILVGSLSYGIYFGGHNWGLNQPAGLQAEAACDGSNPGHSYDSLQAAVSAARYRIYVDDKEGDAFYANNSTHQLSAHFNADAARITVKHNANSDVLTTASIEQANQQKHAESERSQLVLRFIGAGYGDVLHPPQGNPVIITAEDRLTFIHQLTSNHDPVNGWLSVFVKSVFGNTQSEIEEWYVNKPEGIEHGFTLNEPVGERGAGELLTVELGFDGDFLAQAVEEGKAIIFKSEDGKAQLSYAGLKAYDADGLELKATIAVKGAVLSFEVDDTNAVYPIKIDPTFTQQQKLVPGATASDSFGTDVAITGDTAVVGAPFDDVGANTDQGSIFVFVRSGTAWSQQARLFANDGAANDTFGMSVAISANTVVAGAPNDDIGASQDQGSAYVFVRSGAIWTQQARLTVSNSSRLGKDVTIDGDYAAIGEVNKVQIFHRAGTSWTNESNVSGSGNFGASVSLSADTLIVGAPDFTVCVPPPVDDCFTFGAAYIFVRSGTVWNNQQSIVGTSEPAGIGGSVSISGNTVIIGSSSSFANPSAKRVEIWFRSGANWTLQSGINGGTNENIGRAVTIAGETAVYTTLGGNKVLLRTGTTWAQQATLTSVGDKVALSGNTLLTGSSGYAKVDVRSGTIWTEQAELTAQEGAIADQFGHSVAVYGDTAVVGVPFKDVGSASARGSVFVFKRSGSTWQQEAQLAASDGAGGHQFGYSVAIEGDTLVIGAPQPLSGPGAAYVFTRSGMSWTQRTKIIAAGGQTVDLFGHSVSLSGNALVIGSPLDDNEAIGGSNNGSAYVLTGSGATWTLQAHLRAIEEANGDQFGNDVDINGDTIAVGARFVANGASTLQGAVYVFTRTGTTWTQQARLRASDGAASDQFGQSVSVSGGTLAVGAPFHNIAANPDQGAVYLFNRSGSTWTESQILTANDGASSDVFGISVALQSNALLVGASGDDFASTNAQGSAYVFIPFGSTWTQVQKLFAPDGATNDGYGNAVALNDRTLLIGVSGDDFGSTIDQGSAFVLVPGGPLVWTGADSTTWSNGGNWDSSVAPSVFDDVLLPASGVTNEAVLNTNANIHTLTIEAGRSLTINAGSTLTVNGDLTLSGTIVGGGTLVFNGANFTNNNSINNVSVQFGAGTKLVYGGGLYFGKTVTALPGSTLTPFASLTMTRFAVESGGSLHIIGGYTLSLIGAGVVFTDDGGSIVGAGRISFDGTSPQSIAGAVVFPDLTINNAAGVTLGADATVNQTLALTSGDLNTGAFTLSMPAAATSTGTGDVVGNVKRTGFTIATTSSLGNPNNQITFTSGTPPTDITVNLVKQTPSDFANATRRTYTITPNGGSGFAATLRLSYQPSELNGNTESTLGLWRKGGSWTNLGATTRNATDNWVELAGIAQFSPWVISGPAGPTAVEFAGATAVQFEDATLIEWQTGFEVNNLGFNLYRDENGKRTLVNPQLIAGSALVAGSDTSLTAGRSYAWIEKSAQSNGAAYWLEDVDMNGQSTWHGPVYVVQSSGQFSRHKTEQSKLLSALGNQQRAQGQSPFTPVESVASLPRANTATLSLQKTIAPAEAVKIVVTHEGWYRVSYEELLAAGLAKDVNARNLQLIVDGEEQPILVAGKDSGSFDSFEAIEFYGVGTDSPYTNERSYWLVAGNQPGRRIPLIITKPVSEGAESFPFTVERKERSIYFSGLLNGDAENWFGGVVTSNGIDQPITIRSLDKAAQDSAELEVALQGVTSLTASPDHQVEVRVNNQFIGYLLFDGRDHKVERFTLPLAALAEGDNLVTLSARDVTDVSLVDCIRLTYPHKYKADDNSLKLTTAASSTSQAISGFTTDDIRVFDVTDSADVRELAGVIEASNKTSFSIAVDTLMPGRRLLALTPDKFKKPDSISMDYPSSLKQPNAGADFLIITRREWMDALAPLRRLREKQGLVTLLLDVEDIFDEFSFGQKTPYAVRDFLGYASESWGRKPRWVLFAGDASFDTRNYTGLGETDFVPTKLIDTAFMETASDDWLADFNADALPDLATGRLPIRSVEDAIASVNKLLNYELALPLDEIVLLADLNDSFDFESASLGLNALLPSTLRVQQLFRSRNSDATTKANLLSAIYRGQSLVNYTGHGSVSNWRGNMLTTEDARALSNTNRLPLFVMMTCLNGLYQDPLNESLAEALMRNEHGGAIAVWASSGMTFPNEQASINQQLYRSLFGKPILTLGEHVRSAKLATSDADVRRSWILLGDPTLRIK